MAYRVNLNIEPAQLERLREIRGKVQETALGILEDGTNAIKQRSVQNLSGVPFTSETGTHIINKRTGRGAASVQAQVPYGSPYKARVFANAQTQYPGNPESWNYLAILEYGRGEIRPKYTPSARAGYMSRARLVLPGGGAQLVSGVNGFRGATGRYRFVRSIPPMEGKGWMKAALEAATPEVQQIAKDYLTQLLNAPGN